MNKKNEGLVSNQNPPYLCFTKMPGVNFKVPCYYGVYSKGLWGSWVSGSVPLFSAGYAILESSTAGAHLSCSISER